MSRDCSAVPGDCFAEPAPPLIAHATPFTDRYPWEATPAGLPSAPSCGSFASCGSQGGSPGLTSAEISRIIILPADVALLSSQALDPDSLFSTEAPDLDRLYSTEAPAIDRLFNEDFDVERLFSEERPVLGASAPEPKPARLSSTDPPALLPSLIKSLVLPEGLDLRLKALTLAGNIAELYK